MSVYYGYLHDTYPYPEKGEKGLYLEESGWFHNYGQDFCNTKVVKSGNLYEYISWEIPVKSLDNGAEIIKIRIPDIEEDTLRKINRGLYRNLDSPDRYITNNLETYYKDYFNDKLNLREVLFEVLETPNPTTLLTALKIKDKTKGRKQNKVLKTMKTLTSMLKRLLSKKDQTLYKVGYLDDNLELTRWGKDALWGILFDEYKDDLVEIAEEEIKKSEKD